MTHDDDFNDSEYPDPTDTNDDDDFTDTTPCPHCQTPIYEESPRCPHCGHHISKTNTHNRKPLWFLLAAILCLLVTLILCLR